MVAVRRELAIETYMTEDQALAPAPRPICHDHFASRPDGVIV